MHSLSYLRPGNDACPKSGSSLFLLLIGLLLTGANQAATYAPSNLAPPEPAREFRGAWVASVSNIDWPSKPGLPVEQQKTELLKILNRAQELKLNAIILQVRPACDALYESKLEPWSEYLTGQMGKAPEPYYDPLALAIKEAHARGLELHAWFNPFRARHSSAKSASSRNHVSQKQPSLVRDYGRMQWLDPADKAAQEYSQKVFLDVVRRYDVDGIHVDDYFYPYKEKDSRGQILDFPDEPLWNKYTRSGGKLSREDWRRENINQFLSQAYRAIKDEKNWVKFGISPFGIWRPGNPIQIKGYDAYDNLYADSRKWLMQGWLDYFVPQLYWSIEAKEQSYPVLLKWWLDQNPKKRSIWPGMNCAKVGGSWKADEIAKQIQITRQQSNFSGNVHWSMKSLLDNRNNLGPTLAAGVYKDAALIPPSLWLDKAVPKAPKISARISGAGVLTVTWEATAKPKPGWWVVQMQRGTNWTLQLYPPEKATASFAQEPHPEIIAVRGMDRNGNLGAAATVVKIGK
jgi:uncharacterized lipoprotein YddW (UPF0748 family)